MENLSTNSRKNWEKLTEQIETCRLCPRLVQWRERTAAEKVRRFREWKYWGRPIPGFGEVDARLWIIGLAPAAHGGNRTGRVFTGDRSGDWLFRALHRAGFANQPVSTDRNDGLTLNDCFISALVRCAPPANKPLKEEFANCAAYLEREYKLLSRKKLIVCLGGHAFTHTLKLLKRMGENIPQPRPKFSHGGEFGIGNSLIIISSYHPSQQNTFTGRLTEEMFDAIWERARQILESE